MLIACLLSTIGAQSAPAREVETRPNIIMLFTDDQREGTFSADGHPFHQTPNFDALIGESIRFDTTYTATPVCSPSRVSLLTGLSERTHGVGFGTAYALNEAQWATTYPALLQAAGYFTGFIGKFGVEYYTFRGQAADRFDFWWGHDGWTKFLPKQHGGGACKPYHRAEADIITPIMGEAMAAFLDAVPEGKPFCLSVSFNVPHGSQATSMHTGYEGWHRMTRPANENPALAGSPFYDTLHRDETVEIPQQTATDPYAHIPERIQQQDKGRRNQVYDYNYTRETNLEHHIRYGQMIAGLDHVLGELLADLDRRHLRDNTVILFGSDHGLLMGEYGMGGKALLYELAARIPCFVFDPTVSETRGGATVSELVTSTDLTATMLDYAAVEASEAIEGKSLRPLIEGDDVLWRDELFLESLFVLRDTPFQEGVRRGNWKYIRMFDGVNGWDESDINFAGRSPEFEMLFNLKADPGEQQNLIDDLADSPVLADLRARCANLSEAANARRQAYMQAVLPTRR
ncbi:MAG: sulfatase-like hydrolase/transferase [Phycisphaerales bacterium]|nr:sulfatase-like hydrolase/transferase [Phycisphaerales bacterium]